MGSNDLLITCVNGVLIVHRSSAAARERHLAAKSLFVLRQPRLDAFAKLDFETSVDNIIQQESKDEAKNCYLHQTQ